MTFYAEHSQIGLTHALGTLTPILVFLCPFVLELLLYRTDEQRDGETIPRQPLGCHIIRLYH